MNQYTHRYSLTAADMDTRYRMTPNAVLLNIKIAGHAIWRACILLLLM